MKNNCNHRALIQKDGCSVNDCDYYSEVSPKEKQIEEMAKDIPYLTLDREVFVGATEKRIVGWTLSEEDNKMIAKALIEQGYRKITENEVVISKKEYEKITKELVTEQRVKEIAQEFFGKVRKETAREIFNQIIWYAIKRIGQTSGDSFYQISFDRLKDLAKKFGVELGEEK